MTNEKTPWAQPGWAAGFEMGVTYARDFIWENESAAALDDYLHEVRKWRDAVEALGEDSSPPRGKKSKNIDV